MDLSIVISQNYKKILVLALYSLFAFLFWVTGNMEISAVVAFILIALPVLSQQFKNYLQLSTCIVLTHIFLYSLKYFPYLRWPFDFYLASGIGFYICSKFFGKRLFKGLNWSFRFTKRQIFSVVVINVPSILILVWYYSTHKEVANQWPLPQLPVWAVPFVVLLIAAINGLREEIFYRGLLQTQMEENSPAWFTILFQAIFFGVLHFSGAFPQGWLGVALTALWGSAIAIQYRIFRSISLAWLTHSIADAVMFSIILLVR